MRQRHMGLGLLAAAGLSLAVPFTSMAQVATPATPAAPAATNLQVADTPNYVQALREIRRELNGIHDRLKAEKTDRDDDRDKALKGIRQAIDAVNSEIIEYEKAHPDQKAPAENLPGQRAPGQKEPPK